MAKAKPLGYGAVTITRPSPQPHITPVKFPARFELIIRMRTTKGQMTERVLRRPHGYCHAGVICATGSVVPPQGFTATRVYGKIYSTSQNIPDDPPLTGADAATEGTIANNNWECRGAQVIPNALTEPNPNHADNWLRIWVRVENGAMFAHVHETVEFWGQDAAHTECGD